MKIPAFAQAVPRYCPHAMEHFIPCFWQLHREELQSVAQYVGSVPEMMQKLEVAGLKSLSLVIISPLKEAQLIHSSKTFVAEKLNIKDTVGPKNRVLLL